MTTRGFICPAGPLLPAVASPRATAIDHWDNGRDILPRERNMAKPGDLGRRTISLRKGRENPEIQPSNRVAVHWTARPEAVTFRRRPDERLAGFSTGSSAWHRWK
jgi:hypothetical protein